MPETFINHLFLEILTTSSKPVFLAQYSLHNKLKLLKKPILVMTAFLSISPHYDKLCFFLICNWKLSDTNICKNHYRKSGLITECANFFHTEGFDSEIVT